MRNGSAAQKTEAIGQVLPFRRRSKPKIPAWPHGLDNDLARYELDRDEPINERQRMLMNLIAVGIVVMLIGAGVWLADTIQVSAKMQDCALQGRTNCAPIEMPVRG
jgi:hypothetical protein